MRKIKLGVSTLEVPVVAVGCMRIGGMEEREAGAFIGAALEAGANFFDHADIYGGGECERKFAKAAGMSPKVREGMIIQSKCGIRAGMFDFSREHILSAVEGSLKRLETEYLDVLLLHRPDALVEPEEVAEAFDILYKSGEVRHFGVSNQKPMQIELLKKYLTRPIVANQLQLSITDCNMISNGVNVNMSVDSSVDRDGSILDYCRLNDITIQPWSPFQHGFFGGVFLDNPLFPELNKALGETAEKHGVTPTTIVIAWLLRHPAKMQPITGTTSIQRIKECCRAAEVSLSREEWYAIYRAAGNKLP